MWSLTATSDVTCWLFLYIHGSVTFQELLPYRYRKIHIDYRNVRYWFLILLNSWILYFRCYRAIVAMAGIVGNIKGNYTHLHFEVFHSTAFLVKTLGLYSLNGRTSYHKISRSLEAARFWFRLLQSLWNLTDTSAARLPRCLSNFQSDTIIITSNLAISRLHEIWQ